MGNCLSYNIYVYWYLPINRKYIQYEIRILKNVTLGT